MLEKVQLSTVRVNFGSIRDGGDSPSKLTPPDVVVPDFPTKVDVLGELHNLNVNGSRSNGGVADVFSGSHFIAFFRGCLEKINKLI